MNKNKDFFFFSFYFVAQFGVGGNKFVEIGRMETKKESNGAGTWQMAPANKVK